MEIPRRRLRGRGHLPLHGRGSEFDGGGGGGGARFDRAGGGGGGGGSFVCHLYLHLLFYQVSTDVSLGLLSSKTPP